MIAEKHERSFFRLSVNIHNINNGKAGHMQPVQCLSLSGSVYVPAKRLWHQSPLTFNINLSIHLVSNLFVFESTKHLVMIPGITLRDTVGISGVL